MIATRSEATGRQRREAMYSLRRILVRRLQAANRGVPRRRRVEVHRRFAEEWKERAGTDRWGDVKAVLTTQAEVGAGEQSLLLQLAADARPTRIRHETSETADNPREVQPGAGIQTGPGLKSRTNPQEGRQGDLFDLALVAQPS